MSDNEKTIGYTNIPNEKKGPGHYVPATENPKALADQVTRDYLDSLLLSYRHIGVEVPTTEYELFGKKCPTPIMSAALALLEKLQEGGTVEFAKGIKKADSVMWTGWVDMDVFRQVCDIGVRSVCGVKPFKDHDRIFKSIEQATDAGALAMCMDIDECIDGKGQDRDFVFGQLAHQSLEDLRSYIEASKIPFIFKGVLSAEDAKLAVELGAGGIVVSHHKGVWVYPVPPLMAMIEITEAVQGRIPIYTDCGLMDGIDVFKAMAVGANGVGVGRALMTPFVDKGAEGVYELIMRMNDELAGSMAMTGSSDLLNIPANVIRHRRF